MSRLPVVKSHNISRTSTKAAISFIVTMMFIVQPFFIAVSPSDAKASDWGETIGNVLQSQKWGFGSSTNITLDRILLKSGTFSLNTTTGAINTTASDLTAGTKTNISITRYNALVLTSKGTYWQRKSGWDLPDLPTARYFAAPVFGDMDNDGDYDAYIGMNNGTVIYYSNTGTLKSPSWTAKSAWDMSGAPSFAIPTLADLDNDGDIDMLTGDNDGKSIASENTGNKTVPAWTKKPGWDTPDIGGGAGPTLGDLDGDGDFDVIVGDGGGTSNAMKNTGNKNSPTWTNQTSWNPPFINNVVIKSALGDLDADGDLDYMGGLGWSSGGNSGFTRAYNNTGDASGPTWLRNTAWEPTDDIGDYASPTLADLDGDSDLDLMIGSYLGANWAYENLGNKPPSGNFYTTALDAGTAVNWSLVKWSETLPANTDITIYVRTGNSTDPTDGTWSAWSAGLSNPAGTAIPSPPARRIQIRAYLTSTNNRATPILWGMNVTHWRYLPNGTVTTSDITPSDLVRWNNVSVTINAKGETVKRYYSLDLGSNWIEVPGDGNLSAVSTLSGHIRFKANMSTTKPNVTPELTGFKLTYMTLLGTHHIHISPMTKDLVVNSTFQFKAELHDINNNTLNKTLTWTSDIGSITADGNFTAPTTPGKGHVNVTFSTHTASASINVLPGPLSLITVDPTAIVTEGGKNHTINATGYDAFDNKLSGLTFNWTTDAGAVAPAQAASTVYTAKVPPKGTYVNTSGNVTATIGSVKATVKVTILGEKEPPPPPVLVLTNLTINPVNATLKKGDTLKFQSTGLDQFGAQMNVTMNWTSDIGTMVPASGKSSTLTVTIAKGNGTVTATIGDLSATAKVEVIADENNTQNNTTYQKPYILGHIPDQYKSEDAPPWSLDLRPFERGSALGKDLLWHAEGVDTSLVRVSGEYSDNDILIFSPVPNANGNDLMTLVLQDKLGNRAVQDIWVNITPVDDPPVLETVPDLMIHYDDAYSFNYRPYISDVDTSMSGITLSVEAIEPIGKPFTATASGFNVSYFGPKSLIGLSFVVTLAFSDGTTVVRDTLSVQVSDNWVPALLVPLPDVTMREGETKYNVFNLDNYFQDKDKDVIYFTYGNNHINIIINTNHSVDLEASSQWSGMELVTFRATDSKGALVEDDVLVTVIPRNDPPTVQGIPDIFVHYDQETFFDLTPYVKDPDTQAEMLTMTFNHDNVWWSWDPAQTSAHPPRSGTPMLSMTILMPKVLNGNTAPYSVDVTLTVTDGTGTASDTFKVSVGDNWPPSVKAPIPDISFDEDTSLTSAIKLSNYFEDVEGAAITYTARSSMVTVTVKPDSAVDFRAPKDWNGVEFVTFRATDPQGGIAEDTIQVTVRPVNDAPVLLVLDNQSVDAKTLLTVHLRDQMYDVDDDLARLTITVLASDASINVFMSGTDAVIYAQKAGDYTITVTVKDQSGASAEGMFHLTVKAITGPPKRQNSFFEVWAIPMFLIIFLIAVLVAGLVGYRRYYGNYEIDDAFIILRDGRLISHLSRHPITKKDEQVFGSMVAAIQMFIEDAFTDMDGNEATVQRMEFKGNNILIEQGKYMYLALMFTGTPGRKLYGDMKAVLRKVEEKHGSALKEWDGDTTEFADLPHHLMTFVPGGYTKPIKIESEPGSKASKDYEKVDKEVPVKGTAKKVK